MALDQHRGGSGEPLVLIHGLGHTWRGWRPMLAGLERRFDVMAVDLPGFGHSPALAAGIEPTPEALADSVEEAMDEAAFERAHLCGNSLGGWIALELTRRGRALTTVAISPAGLQHARERGWGANILRSMRWLARNTPAPPEALLRNPVGRALFAGPLVARPWRMNPDDLAEIAELYAGAPGFETTLPATFHKQPLGLREIDSPVLLLWGTADLILLPRQGRRFERLIPGAELRYLKGLGHVPMSDDPDQLVAAISDFAGRRPAAENAPAASAMHSGE